MTKEAPAALVLASFRGVEDAARIARSVATQTYSRSRLVFVTTSDDDTRGSVHASLELCPREGLPTFLQSSGAAYAFFWPEEDELHDAALEKLVLGLHVAPDQDGVTDSSRGADGLLLMRLRDETFSAAARWLDSRMKWLTEVQRRKLSFFYIDESLARTPRGSTEYFGAVENAFHRLPYLFENYQPIPETPLWATAEEAADPRSVLFLVTSLPMGGACKFILDAVAQLKSRGYRVAVATTAYDTKNANPWLGELLEIVPDAFILSHARPVELPRLIVHLARTRRCSRVVLSHTMLGYQLLPWLRGQLPEVSFLDYTHIEFETEWPNGGYALRSVNHRSLLDLSLVSSEHLRGWMIERGGNGEKIRVCHTNIDAEKWTPDFATRAHERAELGLDDKAALILYPCRIAEQKRPELLCHIAAALSRATKAPFVIAVAGSGPLLPALKRFVEQNNLSDRFRILGAVSLGRIARLHNAADIFLLPSKIEGIALALFEAMALESVPVVSDVGGQRELVTGDCGFLSPVSEPAREIPAYLAALKTLLEDAAKRRRMAAACRARVRNHFPLSQMGDCLIAALDEADEFRKAYPAYCPEPAHARDIATLAMDHVRLMHQGGLARDHAHDLRELLEKRDKTIAKLQRQLDDARTQTQPTEVYAAA